ncbi:MAG: hypothetical protein KatS3mg005_4121 [Bryobacteraceae bacterium]|nr:MAG: hypothetical protein KatS3mg005_4121 [Bryobacteraceae bacterium]
MQPPPKGGGKPVGKGEGNPVGGVRRERAEKRRGLNRRSSDGTAAARGGRGHAGRILGPVIGRRV